MPSPNFAHSSLSVGWLTDEASMAHRDPSSATPMPTILRYGIAALSVAIAIGLCFFLLQYFDAKLTPFLFAVAATVWYAGTGPGVLAIVLSVLSLNYFFLRPDFSFSPISFADLVYLTFCIFCALAVGWVSAVRRRAEQELRRAREELEAKVVERTANLQRSEERLRVQHTVAQILAEAATIEEATARILRAMGECLGWDVGALWRVDREAEALRCVELWHKASIEVPEFERVSREFAFAPGLGLPGRVWSSLEPEYVPDVVPDENFPRGPIADREGLHAAFGFPILLGGEVLGVIEFFSREIRQPDQELLATLATIGSQIGQFIERKRAEEALLRAQSEFRDYAESASDWYWETDPDHKFTHLTEDGRRLARGFATVSRMGVARWEFATDVQSEPEKWELHRSMLKARQPFRDFVYRATHGDGSVVYNKISGKPVFDSNGEFHGYRGTGTDVTELMRAQEQQTASSEVLRAIANSPHDLQPIFDAILDSATHLCRADSGALRLSEESGLRLVAVRGDPFLVSQVWSSIPVLAEKGSLPDRLAASRLPTHIPDFTAIEGDHRDDFCIRVVNAGIRTGLFVPLLKDNEIVGIISLARKQVQPFTDKQISLFTDFAAQATIALESTRLERQYREAQMALAHANRVATMGQLTASITHEVNQPITAAVTYALAARRFLSADPPNFREADDALSLIVKEGNRAGEVVERVRALIKKVPARKDAVAIDDAILEIIALTRAEAANNSVSVRTQFAEGLPRVQGDRVQLQQVMLNLIVNAIQAMG